MIPRFLVTGTDTGVGKTIVAAGLAGALGASYWKPIQAGLAEPTDSERVAELAGNHVSIIPESYRLETACSPHEAARAENVSISSSRLALPHVAGPLIVEGAGGLMVPVNSHQLMIDLFRLWALPVILVARTSLGTINHSLLSILALRNIGLEIVGVVFVGDPAPSSEAAVVEYGDVRHLGRLPWIEPLSAKTLAAAISANIRLDLLQ